MKKLPTILVTTLLATIAALLALIGRAPPPKAAPSQGAPTSHGAVPPTTATPPSRPVLASYPTIPPPGVFGSVLTSQGPNLVPAWTTPSNLWFSPITGLEQDSSVTFSTVAGSFTCGGMFYIMPNAGSAHTVSGVRFYWKGAANTTKVSLWTIATGGNNGSRVTSSTGPVTGTPGEFTINFASPQALSPGNYYGVSTWDTSGTSVTNWNVASTNYAPYNSLFAVASTFHAYVGGRGISTTPFNSYGIGDSCCVQTSGTGMCAIEPVLQ